jgi:osmotically-inducible protein OsmY
VKATSRALLLLFLAAVGAGCAHQTQAVNDSDPAIRARIEAQLRGRSDLDVRYVSIDVEHGVVTISGIVSSSEDIRTIDKLIKRTHGVDQLLNNLVVQE